MVQHMATAEHMRQSALFTASTLSQASARRAGTDLALAVACAWAADVNRVMAALWGRAGMNPDAHSVFFRLADKVLKTAHNSAPSSGGLLERTREQYVRACMSMSIPLVLPHADQVTTVGDVDLTDLAVSVTGVRDPQGFVASTLAEARNVPDFAVRARMTVHAYVVDVAVRTGDDSLVSAAARIAALEDLYGLMTDSVAVLEVARRFLGPVESVRLKPYLRQTGLV